jgi:hypothetical protein
MPFFYEHRCKRLLQPDTLSTGIYILKRFLPFEKSWIVHHSVIFCC